MGNPLAGDLVKHTVHLRARVCGPGKANEQVCILRGTASCWAAGQMALQGIILIIFYL